MGFQEIREGIKTVLEGANGVPGLTVYASPPEGIKANPCLIVFDLGDLEYNPILAAGGFHGPIMARVYLTSNYKEGVKLAEEYKWPNGDKSLFRAINTDNQLNNSCNHAWIRRVGELEAGHDDNSDARELSFEVELMITHSVS